MSNRITSKNIDNLLPYFAKVTGLRIATHRRDNGGIVVSSDGNQRYSLAIINGNSAYDMVTDSTTAKELYDHMHFVIDLLDLKEKQSEYKYRLVERSQAFMDELVKLVTMDGRTPRETTKLNDPEFWKEYDLPSNARRAVYFDITHDIFIQFYQGEHWYKVEPL